MLRASPVTPVRFKLYSGFPIRKIRWKGDAGNDTMKRIEPLSRKPAWTKGAREAAPALRQTGVSSGPIGSDPRAPPAGLGRVRRGGSRYNGVIEQLSANHSPCDPGCPENRFGFRLARRAP
jgi:hypothetical protein